jgi:hypothetical protein
VVFYAGVKKGDAGMIDVRLEWEGNRPRRPINSETGSRATRTCMLCKRCPRLRSVS